MCFLVNSVWFSIYEDVLSIGNNVEFLDFALSSNLLKVEKLFERSPNLENKKMTTSKSFVDGKEYVWVAIHLDE